MALFRGQTLYLRAATRDVTFGTNVRSLLGTAGADTNFTITFTAAATQTVNPYTNISNVTADNRTNLGWALNQNEASTDGMGSSATAKRFVPAGVWQFSNLIEGSAPALLANYNVTLEYSVYRVAANGGTRTLLFSFSGNAINRTAAGTFTATASSPSQPAYTFEPNETLHIAYRITSANTTSVLGGSTNTVLTINGATSGSQVVTLPSPGLRTLYFDTNSSIGEAVGTESILTRKDLITGIGEGSGTHDYLAEFFRTFNAIGEADAQRALIVLIKDTITAIGKGVGTESILVRKDTITGIGEGVGTESILVRKDTFNGIGEGAGTYDYLAEFFREFESVGEAEVIRNLLIVIKDNLIATGSGIGSYDYLAEFFREFESVGEGAGTISKFILKDIVAEGESVADLMRAVVFVRDFLGEGESVADIARVVIFVRDFLGQGKGQVKPRIALDWDDLPEPGEGGGTTIVNTYRPVFVFDD